MPIEPENLDRIRDAATALVEAMIRHIGHACANSVTLTLEVEVMHLDATSTRYGKRAHVHLPLGGAPQAPDGEFNA